MQNYFFSSVALIQPTWQSFVKLLIGFFIKCTCEYGCCCAVIIVLGILDFNVVQCIYHNFFSIMIIFINNLFLLIKGLLLADHDELYLYLIPNRFIYLFQ